MNADVGDDVDAGDGVTADRVDTRRKRGRPPRVDTPMECRIKNVMRSLRKLKDQE